MTVACIVRRHHRHAARHAGDARPLRPSGWHTPWFGWRLDLDWRASCPRSTTASRSDGWSIFGAFFMMMLFKGVLQAGAGPAPNYDMQRDPLHALAARRGQDERPRDRRADRPALHARSPASPCSRSASSAGSCIAMGTGVDFELILPVALRNFIPTGLARTDHRRRCSRPSWPTYSATVNAAPAYIVNDIYKRYINPQPPAQRTLVRLSYAASIVVVVIGTGIGLLRRLAQRDRAWIVSALYGGYTASNVLKWYWWRFNSYGFFWGMVGGIVASMLVPVVLPSVSPIYAFPVILARVARRVRSPARCSRRLTTRRCSSASTPGAAVGLLGAGSRTVVRRHPALEPNGNFRRDMANVVVGIVWQTALVAIGIYLVLRDVRALAVSVRCSSWSPCDPQADLVRQARGLPGRPAASDRRAAAA